MPSQDLIQRRSLDYKQRVISDTVNLKFAALTVWPDNVVIDGFEPIKLSNTKLKITPGYGLKDRVLITYIDKVEIDTTLLADADYCVVMHYERDLVEPPNAAEIKTITLAEYQANSTKYVFLAYLEVVNGLIVTLLDHHPTISTIRVPRWGHSELSGLQGGKVTSNEYYHLSEAEHTALSSLVVSSTLDHNADLSNIQGGDVDEYYHFLADEGLGISAILSDDQVAWHANFIYTDLGGFVNADKLGTLSSTDLALAVHTHEHKSLSDLQGGVADEYYHFDQTEHAGLQTILTSSVVENTEKLGGRLASDFALAIHNHQHYNLLNVQGGAAFQQFHLSLNDRNSINAIANETVPFPNVDKLDGKDSTGFALAEHVHSHTTSFTGKQGGTTNQYYHVKASSISFIANVISGAQKIPNADLINGKTAADFAFSGHTHNHGNINNTQGGVSGQKYHLTKNFYDSLSASNSPSATNVLLTKSFVNSNNLQHTNLLVQGGQYHLTSSQVNLLTGAFDASSLHVHGSSYYTKTLSEGKYVNVTGDSIPVNSLSIGNHKITNLATPVSSSDIASKSYADTKLAGSLNHNQIAGLQGGSFNDYYHIKSSSLTNLTTSIDGSLEHLHASRYYKKSVADTTFIDVAGDTITSNLNMNGNRINVAPLATDPTDIVTKSYVEAAGVIIPTGTLLRHTSNNATAMTSSGYVQVNKTISFPSLIAAGSADTLHRHVYPVGFSQKGEAARLNSYTVANNSADSHVFIVVKEDVLAPYGGMLYQVWYCYDANVATNSVSLVQTFTSEPVFPGPVNPPPPDPSYPVPAFLTFVKIAGKYYSVFANSLQESTDLLSWTVKASVGNSSAKLAYNAVDNTIGIITAAGQFTRYDISAGTKLGPINMGLAGTSIANFDIFPALSNTGNIVGFYVYKKTTGEMIFINILKTGAALQYKKVSLGVTPSAGNRDFTMLNGSAGHFHMMGYPTTGGLNTILAPCVYTPGYSYVTTSVAISNYASAGVSQHYSGGSAYAVEVEQVVGPTDYFTWIKVQTTKFSGSSNYSVPAVSMSVRADTSVVNDRMLLEQSNFYYKKL